MRIGYDARVLYRRDVRGMGRYLYNLVGNLIDLRQNDEFYLFYEEESSACFPGIPRVREIRFEQRGYRFRLWEQMRLPVEIIRHKLDLFHSPANSVPVLQTVPFVLTLHDACVFAVDDPHDGDQNYLRRILPLAARFVDGVVTVSEHSRNEIIRYVPALKNKIRVIYEGVDPVFRASTQEETRRAKTKFELKEDYILSVAATSPKKQTAEVIRVFSKLKSSVKEKFELVLTGNQYPDDRVWMEIAKDLGVQNRVRVLDYVPGEDLRSLYGGASVFLYLSIYEGFGLPVLEAMACGTPVIASDKTSLPEVVGDAGILVNPLDPAECAALMERVLADPDLLLELKRKGFERARLFSWKKTAEETSKIYDEVLKRAKCSSHK